jgi:transcriptional regulator with XRE-family HTH domain
MPRGRISATVLHVTINANADIKALREAQGLSQQQLAATADCSLSMVRLLETGYRPEPSFVLDRVLKALNRNAVPRSQHSEAQCQPGPAENKPPTAEGVRKA